MTKVFPVVLVVLNLAAAAVSFYQHDIRRGLYWLFSAGLIACVTV